jgi:hypothetical protein
LKLANQALEEDGEWEWDLRENFEVIATGNDVHDVLAAIKQAKLEER